jgi:hypothetical protein
VTKVIGLSVLDHISIASPCPARWEDMEGNDRVRFCGQCRLNVYNLSAMERNEAEELVATHKGRLCAGFYRRVDGTILTRDCPVGLAAVRARVARVVARVGAVLGVLLMGRSLLGMPPHERPRLRTIEPFSTICAWIAPRAPVVSPAPLVAGRVLLGKLSVLQPLPPAAPIPNWTGVVGN